MEIQFQRENGMQFLLAKDELVYVFLKWMMEITDGISIHSDSFKRVMSQLYFKMSVFTIG
jgi:hypothetical protein